MVLLLPLWAAWRTFQFLRERQFRFDLVWLLGAMAACAVMATVWAILRPFVWQIAQEIPQQEWRMHGGWIGDDVDLMPFTDGSWGSALAQWLARGGPYFSAIVGSLILLVWFYPRPSVGHDKRFLGGSLRESQQHWAANMRQLARSAAVAAACLLSAYLWWAADFVHTQECVYQETMRGIRNPRAAIDQLAQARAQILASDQDTAEIRQAVAAEMKADMTADGL